MLMTYPSTALRTSQVEVKQAAQDNQVIVTDSGGRSFFLLTEDGYDGSGQDTGYDEAYFERVARAIRRGRAGIARGEYVVGVDAAIALSERMRARRG